MSVPVTVYDVTGRENDEEFTLDTSGFQFLRHTSQAAVCREDNYEDESKLTSDYFPECEQFLKEVTGAGRALVFDHKVRRGPSNWHKLGPGNANKRGPLHRVHVDQSYEGAAFLVKLHYGNEADELLSKRWQIINMWRPIKDVYKDPLAVADARSIAEDDLVEARVIYPDYVHRTWTVKPPPVEGAHKWYYKHNQTPDEVCLIKCFDSIDNDSVARRVPHSAFRNREYDDKDPRESIEVRAFLFFD